MKAMVLFWLSELFSRALGMRNDERDLEDAASAMRFWKTNASSTSSVSAASKWVVSSDDSMVSWDFEVNTFILTDQTDDFSSFAELRALFWILQ